MTDARRYTFRAHRPIELAIKGQPNITVVEGSEFTIQLEPAGLRDFISNLASTTAELVKLDGEAVSHAAAMTHEARRRVGFY